MTSKDQVAQVIIGEAKARNHTRDECLGELSALYQESQWDETVWDSTHVTYGVAQQDGSYPHRFEGAAAQVKAFFDKLDVKRADPGHGDIWLNICWLQQAPNWPSAQYWWDHGRQAYLTEIKSRIDTVTPYLDKYWPTIGVQPVTDPSRPDFNEYAVWSNNSQPRNGTAIDFLCIHTQEAPGNADSLAHYLGGNVSASYHYTCSQASDGGVTVCDVVNTDLASWSVLSANNRSINYCFAGSSVSWTTDQWMQQSKAIDVVAYLIVQDAKKYKISINVQPPPYTHNPPTISDHAYVTRFLGDGTHTDVGPNFPWVFFTAAVKKYSTPQEVPVPAPKPVKPTDPNQLTSEVWDQLRISWPQLGNRTLVDAVAAIMQKLGV